MNKTQMTRTEALTDIIESLRQSQDTGNGWAIRNTLKAYGRYFVKAGETEAAETTEEVVKAWINYCQGHEQGMGWASFKTFWAANFA